jgi:hypothetical protein
MKNNRFSEPEQFLMGNWADVALLKQSIKSISDKYDLICGEVIDAIRVRFPELNNSRIVSDSVSSGRQIAIGNQEWPNMYPRWPSGLYVSEISLEDLTSDEGDDPGASIWLKPPTGLNWDHVNARTRVHKAAEQLLTPELLNRRREDDDLCLWYILPESRQDLLDMLLKDQAQDFVECLVSHFAVLAKFIPVIDELFEAQKPVRGT